MSVNNAYKCVKCESVQTKPATGVRTLQPCETCNDITTWEETDEIPDQPMRGGAYTEEHLITQFEYAAKEAGGKPSKRELKRYTGLSANPYIRVWGSFEQAKEEIL